MLLPMLLPMSVLLLATTATTNTDVGAAVVTAVAVVFNGPANQPQSRGIIAVFGYCRYGLVFIISLLIVCYTVEQLAGTCCCNRNMALLSIAVLSMFVL